ncbi:hypothetical protein GCM10007301_42550 [Azorhizobium oxalatiphilum]|uniref:Uncharacterized protein n=1 Tax=Azorhizobium oxalatiphilum TaxID=980631 RepID=A0A917FHC1_9HYPH|nr:hypothetical protein [Azorhizobium oxalatiphilum]GGF78057.1 hypothetical protein GCM10007301_42550 [Azorhizobium oxalatiphilum]
MSPKAPLPPRRALDLSRRTIALLFLICFVLVAIPIVTHPIPPLSDYVNHLARMKVIAAVPGDPDLSRFYFLQWSVLPNLMMDMVVPLLDRFADIYVAGEIYTLMCFALIAFGTLYLHRALFGAWSAIPLVAFPLLYNNIFLIGVMNYIFGIGLCLCGLATWILLRDRPWPWRYAVSCLFVLALFFCHLFATGVYGVGILSYELMRLFDRKGGSWKTRIIAFVTAGFPFALTVPLLLMSPTWGLKGENYWEPRGKLDGIEFVINVYYDYVAFSLTAVVVLAAAWAVRHRLLRTHNMLFYLLVIAGAVYMALPRTVFATYMADQRMPVAIAFMVIACIQIDLRHRLAQRGFAIMLVLLVAVRVTEVQVVWNNLTQWTVAFQESITKIKRGSKVMVAYADPWGGSQPQDLGLVHAACLAIIERSSLVTTAFTVPGKQILRVHKPYTDWVDTEDGTPPNREQLLVTEEEPTPDGPRYWDLWPQHFDYVYLLFTEPGDPNPDSDRLELVYAGDRFQLYKVIKPPPAS